MLIYQTKDGCPCGSGLSYADCCETAHQGKPVETAEALMRSRYTAFVKKNGAYLRQSWCSKNRPRSLSFDDQLEWLGLEIRRIEKGQKQDQQGVVEFVAYYHEGATEGRLHEVSQFKRNAKGQWCYLTGELFN